MSDQEPGPSIRDEVLGKPRVTIGRGVHYVSRTAHPAASSAASAEPPPSPRSDEDGGRTRRARGAQPDRAVLPLPGRRRLQALDVAPRRDLALVGAQVMADRCMLCGEPLPPVTWWTRITGTAPPTHDPKGPQADACWTKFNERMGIEHPGPRPT